MNVITPCLAVQLPFSFEQDRLAHDLSVCTTAKWQAHFNNADYAGVWTSIALYSPGGEPDDIRTFGDSFRPTSLLASCPYFSFIIDQLECGKESVRLLNLAAGSVIKEHRDRGLAYEHGSFRVHVPIHTNDEVDFVVGGKRLDMKAGECWYANFDLPHSVNNRSTKDRVHLVIDCIRNAWTDRLFEGSGYDFEMERRRRVPDEKTMLNMITELERMNTPASRTIIAELKNKLNA